MIGWIKLFGFLQFLTGSVLGSLGHHLAKSGTVMEVEATLWYVVALLGAVVYLLARLVESSEDRAT